MTKLRAITLYQPHASLVALGVKTILDRDKPTEHRGRIAIHAAAAEPRKLMADSAGMMGDWWVVNDGGAACLLDHRPGRGTDADLYGLPLGAVVATANLVDCVPIYAAEDRLPIAWQRHVAPTYMGELRLWNGPSPTINYSTGRPTWTPDVIEDQRPFGDFTPGRWAWLLEDIAPTEDRCPACWGECFEVTEDRSEATAEAWGVLLVECRWCGGQDHCPPIPARGRQGLWRWEP